MNVCIALKDWQVQDKMHLHLAVFRMQNPTMNYAVHPLEGTHIVPNH